MTRLITHDRLRWASCILIFAACKSSVLQSLSPTDDDSVEVGTSGAPEKAEEAEAQDPVPTDAEDTPPRPSDEPEALREARKTLQQEVSKTAATLDAREVALAKQEADLKRTEQEFETRLNSIKGLEKRLDELLGIGEVAKNRRSQRIDALAQLLSAMPPQAAADMIAKMSDDDAQALVMALSRKSERKASKVLSAMPGDRAAQIGKIFLENDPQKPAARSNTSQATTNLPTAPEPTAAANASQTQLPGVENP